jgi:GntR family transcriptional repressor for pyruvate dehydrogenase complex
MGLVGGGEAAAAPVRPRQLVDLVVEELERWLRDGRFPVGSKLPSEPELMTRFGVGRTTIREAIRVFSHARMLEVRQGDGTYVRALAPPPTATLVEPVRGARALEVFEVRRALELEAVRLAALRRDASDLRTLRRLVARLRGSLAAGDRAEFLAVDIELHLAMARSAKNPVLLDFYRSFASVLQEAIAQVLLLPGAMESCVARHERALEAITRRDAERAQALTAGHLESVTAMLRDLVDRRAPAREGRARAGKGRGGRARVPVAAD